MSTFHSALASAVGQLGGDAELVASLSVEQCADVIQDALSSIARIDFIVTQGSGLTPPVYTEILSIWAAAGAPEGAGPVLHVLYRRNRLALSVAQALFQAGVSAEYLSGCMDAGVFDTERICLGWESDMPLDYLVAIQ